MLSYLPAAVLSVLVRESMLRPAATGLAGANQKGNTEDVETAFFTLRVGTAVRQRETLAPPVS